MMEVEGEGCDERGILVVNSVIIYMSGEDDGIGEMGD